MTAVEEILSRVPLAEVARELGVSEAEAEVLARQSIPTLLGGMQANASDPGDAASLESALREHAEDDVTAPSLAQIDVQDGSKIVGNIFGANSESVIQSLGARSDGGSTLIGQLLPILAPMVLKYLAGKVLDGGSSGADPNTGGSSGGCLLGGILGELLGGRAGAPATPARERADASAATDGPTFDGPAPGNSGNSTLTVPGSRPDSPTADSEDPETGESDSVTRNQGSLMESLKDLFGMGRRG